MWPWIKRWRDWVMNDLWPTYRINHARKALHYSYEKAGLVLHDQPIPWNADGVLVEASLHLPTPNMRRQADFQLCLGTDQTLTHSDSIHNQEGISLGEQHRYCVSFRVKTPRESTTAVLLWRGHALGELPLPVLSRDEFLDGLRLQMPTLFVRLGEENVACKTFVSNQCRGLLANGLLVNQTSLVPLVDMELFVEFYSERTNTKQRVPVRLSSSQLGGRQALLTAIPPRYPRRLGAWTATWFLGDRELATQRVAGISQKQFQRSLRVSDTRFVIQACDGSVALARQAPRGTLGERIGPCFLVCSREAGMAGLCSFRVTAQVPGAMQPPLLLEQEVLITDGPTLVAPGTLDAVDLEQVRGFDLTLKGHSLCLLPLGAAPTATFTSEGGFKPPSDYAWSSAAEVELNERLNRLLGNGSKTD